MPTALRPPPLSLPLSLPLLLALAALGACADRPREVYQRTLAALDRVKVIDTHEHQGLAKGGRHSAMDLALELRADLISAGLPASLARFEDLAAPQEFWDDVAPYLRFTRATGFHAQFIAGLREMYGHPGGPLTRTQFLDLSRRVDASYRDYAGWLERGLERTRIDFMLVDRVDETYDLAPLHKRFGYLFRVDPLVLGVSQAARARQITDRRPLELLGRASQPAADLAAYLAFADAVLARVERAGVLGLKVALAARRPIVFSDPGRDEAAALYAQPARTPPEELRLQDFVLHHLMRGADRARLPVQIHTGYLQGTRAQLDPGDPAALQPLLHRYPGVPFVLLHGGYPWTSVCAALGKSFPNVYLDLSWLPQLSRTRAMSALHEILDTVPYNKLTWGGDSHNIDQAAGALRLAKEVVATVLAERLARGWLTQEVAADIARRLLRDNALELYRLRPTLEARGLLARAAAAPR